MDEAPRAFDLEAVRREAARTIPQSMEFYEACVQALLEAYRTGTPEAMERHYRLTWHRRPWKGMRTYVQIGLGGEAADDIEITEEDARWLIAREHGFEDWEVLTRSVESSVRPAWPTERPVGLMAAAQSPDAEPAVRTRDWRGALELLEAAEFTGLDAHREMTDERARHLVRAPHLSVLRLGGSRALTDEGVRLLARLPHVEVLDLSGTSITDAGVAALRELRGLRRLSLAWTRVTDAGVSQLADLDRLESVDLAGSGCGDGAIRSLAGNRALRRFASGARTTDAGLPAFKDYPAFRHWSPDADADGWDGSGEEPNRLWLRGAITDDGVAALAGLHGLFALDLDDERLPLTGRGLEPLVELRNLASLSFHARDDAMSAIARLPRLRFLAVQDTPASDTGWQALGASTSIERIWGRRCHGLGPRGFLALSGMPRLKNLAASCLNVGDSALLAFPAFPSLRELMPMDVPDEGYRHIGRCERLEALVLMYCRDTTDRATELVSGLALRRYFASYTQITDHTVRMLAGMESLEDVTFDSCARITNAGVSALAALPRLRTLRISGRRLSSAVTGAFPAHVSVQYSL